MPRPRSPITNPRTDEFVLLAKIVGSRVWQQVSNPLWIAPQPEGYALQMLKQNWFAEYVEYVISGVTYRVVRSGNVGAYRLE